MMMIMMMAPHGSHPVCLRCRAKSYGGHVSIVSELHIAHQLEAFH